MSPANIPYLANFVSNNKIELVICPCQGDCRIYFACGCLLGKDKWRVFNNNDLSTHAAVQMVTYWTFCQWLDQTVYIFSQAKRTRRIVTIYKLSEIEMRLQLPSSKTSGVQNLRKQSESCFQRWRGAQNRFMWIFHPCRWRFEISKWETVSNEKTIKFIGKKKYYTSCWNWGCTMSGWWRWPFIGKKMYFTSC